MSGQNYCAVLNCNTSATSKPSYVNLYSFPTTNEMRSKWLAILKTRCSIIDWSRSRICSKHFENKYFTSQKQLKSNAIPTMFPATNLNIKYTTETVNKPPVKNKLDRLMSNLTQTQLQEDVKKSLQQFKMPENLPYMVNDELKCLPNASSENQLWLIIKKQEHLITRLNQLILRNKKHVEVLQKNMEENRTEKKEMEQALENYKYIAKCLQEKQATLEEQIEILTAVESR